MSPAIAEAIFRICGGKSKAACARVKLWVLSAPMLWNWALISAIWKPASWLAIPALLPAPGSRPDARAGVQAAFLAILIARSNPLDQFIMENPDYFFSLSPEHCRINPDNLLILLHHIKSAAFELPFERGETFGGENLEELLRYLEEKRVLHQTNDSWHWAAESYPADEISLRAINPGKCCRGGYH